MDLHVRWRQLVSWLTRVVTATAWQGSTGSACEGSFESKVRTEAAGLSKAGGAWAVIVACRARFRPDSSNTFMESTAFVQRPTHG